MKVEVSRVIAVDADRAWELLGDFYNVHHIHPKVKNVTRKSDNDGLGAIRQCNFYDGKSVQEEVIAFSDENRSYTIKLLPSTDFPLNAVVATLRIQPRSASSCEMFGEMDIDPKYGVFGKIMGHLLIKPQFANIIGNVFSGVQEYNRTGVDVPENWKPSAAAVKA